MRHEACLNVTLLIMALLGSLSLNHLQITAVGQTHRLSVSHQSHLQAVLC